MRRTPRTHLLRLAALALLVCLSGRAGADNNNTTPAPTGGNSSPFEPGGQTTGNTDPTGDGGDRFSDPTDPPPPGGGGGVGPMGPSISGSDIDLGCINQACAPRDGQTGGSEGTTGTSPPPGPAGGQARPERPGSRPKPEGGPAEQEFNPDGSPKTPREGGGSQYGLGKDGVEATVNQAQMALGFEDYATACSYAQQALREDPAHPKAKRIEQQACRRELDDPRAGAGAAKNVAFGEGILNSKATLLRGAAGGSALDAQGASRTEEFHSWTRRLMQAREAGDARAAAKAAEEALKLAPENVTLLVEKAVALNKLRDYKAALAAAEKALSLDPRSAAAWAAKAFALGGLGDRQGMIDALKMAASLDPQFEAALRKAQSGDLADMFGGAAPKRKAGVLVWAGGAAAAGLAGLSLLIFAARRQQQPQKAAAPAGTGEVATIVEGPPSLSPGAVVGESYRIKGELGRGGMGVVYEAIDETLQRRVAIKQLQRGAGTSEADLERFIREARLVAQLKHPNLAEIYNVVTAGDPLLVFEFVEGQPLDKVLAMNRKLPLARARAILAEVAAALDYAHAKNIIHRDLKPSNVMIGSTGTAKVMDFGIAHQSRSAAATKTGVSGTPAYMAPEQTMGSVSKAADFYSLGVMAYEMVCGARPFDGPDFLEQKLQRRLTPVQRRELSLPPTLDQFFALALDPDPTKRPPTGAHFIHWFDQAVQAGGQTPSLRTA